MFSINEPESRLVCIQAIHWLLRNELLPRLTVDNHENVTNTESFRSAGRREAFPPAFGAPRSACLQPFHTPDVLLTLELLGLRNSWWRRNWSNSIQFFKQLEQFIIPAFQAPTATWGPEFLQTPICCSLQCGFLQASNSQLACRGVNRAVNTTGYSLYRGLSLLAKEGFGDFYLSVSVNIFKRAVCHKTTLWMLTTAKWP